MAPKRLLQPRIRTPPAMAHTTCGCSQREDIRPGGGTQLRIQLQAMATTAHRDSPGAGASNYRPSKQARYIMRYPASTATVTNKGPRLGRTTIFPVEQVAKKQPLRASPDCASLKQSVSQTANSPRDSPEDIPKHEQNHYYF